MRIARFVSTIFLLLAVTGAAWSTGSPLVQCANLIYAGNKTSVCFSNHFLQRLQSETNVATDVKLTPVHLDSDALFSYPFAIMTGEGSFQLTPRERVQLAYYVEHGGFLLASASCSDPDWGASFRREMGIVFPKFKLATIPASHPLYRTVYTIGGVKTTHEGNAVTLEGLTYKGKVVIIFSKDGLNDTAHTDGCCCCGGDEVDQAEMINVNLFAYALLH